MARKRAPRKSQARAPKPLGSPHSPYIFTEEASQYLRFGNPQLFREWVWKYGVPHKKRGRRMMFTKAELDAFMEQQEPV